MGESISQMNSVIGLAIAVLLDGSWITAIMHGGDLVVQLNCTLYAYVRSRTNVSQSFWCCRTRFGRLEILFALKHYTSPLSCEWYSAVSTILTPSSLQSAAHNSGENWGPLSVCTVDYIPKLTKQCPIKLLAIRVVVVFAVGIALACSE